MDIIFSDERMPGQAIMKAMEEAGKLCVSEEGLDPGRITVSVTFSGTDEIKELNKLYRNKDEVTDVLSFPQYENVGQMPKIGEILLGDVVICTEQALMQADEYGHSGERELVYLFVHSMFHLLGYDHLEERDREEMRIMEEKIMCCVGLER